MLKIPSDTMKQFEAVLVKKISPVSRHADYLKWLRDYLDLQGCPLRMPFKTTGAGTSLARTKQ